MEANKKIFDHLKGKNMVVHFPGIKTGDCTAPYVVIKDMGQYGNSHNGSRMIHLIIFVPHYSYKAIFDIKDQLKAFMSELSYRPTGVETPIIPEERNKSYSTSIEYRVFKKN